MKLHKIAETAPERIINVREALLRLVDDSTIAVISTVVIDDAISLGETEVDQIVLVWEALVHRIGDIVGMIERTGIDPEAHQWLELDQSGSDLSVVVGIGNRLEFALSVGAAEKQATRCQAS